MEIQQIFNLVYNQPYNGPITGSFTPGKKSMLISFSGSAFASHPTIIGAELHFNGLKVLEAKSFTNEAASHKAFIPVNLLFQNPNDDVVNFEIIFFGGSIADYNDFFNLTVTVFK